MNPLTFKSEFYEKRLKMNQMLVEGKQQSSNSKESNKNKIQVKKTITTAIKTNPSTKALF